MTPSTQKGLKKNNQNLQKTLPINLASGNRLKYLVFSNAYNKITEKLRNSFRSETNSERFNTAKEEEIKKWKEMDTFQEVEDTGQHIISCRWICTEKMKGGILVSKAPLVVRGFEEDTTQIKKDSPTCNKESVRLLLCLLSGNNWSLHSMDIKSAFLQGNNDTT